MSGAAAATRTALYGGKHCSQAWRNCTPAIPRQLQARSFGNKQEFASRPGTRACGAAEAEVKHATEENGMGITAGKTAE